MRQYRPNLQTFRIRTRIRTRTSMVQYKYSTTSTADYILYLYSICGEMVAIWSGDYLTLQYRYVVDSAGTIIVIYDVLQVVNLISLRGTDVLWVDYDEKLFPFQWNKTGHCTEPVYTPY